MGGVASHHGAQQPEEHLANLKEASATCPQPAASLYGVALPRQEVTCTTKVLMPIQTNSDVDTKMTTHVHDVLT